MRRYCVWAEEKWSFTLLKNICDSTEHDSFYGSLSQFHRNLSGLDLQKEMLNTVTVWYAVIKGSTHFKPRCGGFVVLASLDPGIFLLSLLYNFPFFMSVLFVLLQMVERTETAHQIQSQ